MSVAELTAEQSYAKDRKVGAVIIANFDTIISASYNGTYPGLPNETELDGKTLPSVYHAEEMAILKAAKLGVPLAGTIMICTLSPCINCAKMIAGSGINHLIFKEVHKRTEGLEFLREVGLLTTLWNSSSS